MPSVVEESDRKRATAIIRPLLALYCAEFNLVCGLAWEVADWGENAGLITPAEHALLTSLGNVMLYHYPR